MCEIFFHNHDEVKYEVRFRRWLTFDNLSSQNRFPEIKSSDNSFSRCLDCFLPHMSWTKTNYCLKHVRYCFVCKKLSTKLILWHPCNLIWPQRWIEFYAKLLQAIVWNYFVFCVADFQGFKVVAGKTSIKTKMHPVIWGVQGVRTYWSGWILGFTDIQYNSPSLIRPPLYTGRKADWLGCRISESVD